MPTTMPGVHETVNAAQVIGVDHAYLTISLATAVVVVAALLGFTWRASRAAYAAERTNHHLANLSQKFEALVAEFRSVLTEIAVVKSNVTALQDRVDGLECDHNGSGNSKRRG